MKAWKWDGRLKMVVFYLLFYFVNAVTVSLENDTFQTWLGPERASFFHYLAVGMLGAGTLAFHFSRKLFPGEKERRIVLSALVLLYLLSLAGMLVSVNSLGAVICALLAGFLSGFLGGAVYYYLAIALEGKSKSGLLFGVGTALGILLQYVLWNTLHLKVVLIVILLVLFVTVTHKMFLKPDRELFENSLPFARDDEKWEREIRRQLVLMVLVAICYESFFCLSDVYLVQAFFRGAINSYAWPLLFRGLGFIAVGMAADFRKGKHFEILAFCGILLNLLTALSLNSLASGIILSIFYFAVGVQEGFLAISFMTLAVRSKHPELWAGFGKVIYLFEALWSLLLRVELSETVFMLAQICLLVTSLLLIVMGNLNVFVRPMEQEGKDEEAMDPLGHFADQNGLTPREKEVLAVLLDSEDSMKELATKVLLSERVLYRYVKSIHEKTGTNSRAGLMKAYYESRLLTENAKGKG